MDETEQTEATEEELQETQLVDVIASGYEWTCPACETYNTMSGHQLHVECKNCGEGFETNPPEHCYD